MIRFRRSFVASVFYSESVLIYTCAINSACIYPKVDNFCAATCLLCIILDKFWELLN